ncbi:MAG: DUF4870 domain-containing protein [Actinomycetota bacterium]|nr:DUF4870 domain-containing protein [Actinomycetota bacterium]
MTLREEVLPGNASADRVVDNEGRSAAMQQGDPNYGSEGESRLRRIRVGGEGGPGEAGDSGRADAGYEAFGTGDEGPVMGGSSMSARDEQTWSILAHLSTLLTLISGIGGPIAALVIWLVYKDRSDRVGFHALQSLWYQVAWFGIFAVYGLTTIVLSIVTLGLATIVLVPLAFLLAFVPIVHQCYAAYKVNGGVDYRYPFVADMVDRNHRFG